MKRTSLVEVTVFCVIVFFLAAYFSIALALDGLVFVLIVLFFLYFVRMMRPKPGEQVDF
jgi:Flp pilus assembly protein TadB